MERVKKHLRKRFQAVGRDESIVAVLARADEPARLPAGDEVTETAGRRRHLKSQETINQRRGGG